MCDPRTTPTGQPPTPIAQDPTSAAPTIRDVVAHRMRSYPRHDATGDADDIARHDSPTPQKHCPEAPTPQVGAHSMSAPDTLRPGRTHSGARKPPRQPHQRSVTRSRMECAPTRRTR